jgi:hypothetical protein
MRKISETRHREELSGSNIIGHRPAAGAAVVLLLVTLLAAGCGQMTAQAQTSGTRTAGTPTATPIAATPTLSPTPMTCTTGPSVPVTLTRRLLCLRQRFSLA